MLQNVLCRIAPMGLKNTGAIQRDRSLSERVPGTPGSPGRMFVKPVCTRSHICILFSYFTLPKQKMSLEQEEEMMNSDRGAYCMAHNGWVMSDDPLRNFAEPGTFYATERTTLCACDYVCVTRTLVNKKFYSVYRQCYSCNFNFVA